MVAIRPFEAKDAPRCTEINLAAFKSFLAEKIGADHEFFKIHFTPELMLKSAASKDDLSERATFVAEEDGKIVGLVTVSASKLGLGSFESVAVAPDCFSKGVGTLLMRTAETFWAERQQRKIATCVSAHNKKALMYYLKNDFIPEGFQRDHFLPGVDEIILGRFLTPK